MTFVIVHGGWGGGWEWTPVARLLRKRGHDVFTPTLTGLGERAHLPADTGLTGHIDDVLGVLRFEELHDIILCGHSYGGMVVTGAADRAPEMIRLVIYLDALVPSQGQSVLDVVPPEFAGSLRAGAGADRKVPIPPDLLPPEGVIPEERRTSYVARLRPHPLSTMTEPIALSGAITRLRRAFVHCTAPADEGIGPIAARARAEGWPYREIATPHDLQLADPDGTAAVLDDLAKSR
jgi:pimeloyl-ACP methyl ester carboxylesterase